MCSKKWTVTIVRLTFKKKKLMCLLEIKKKEEKESIIHLLPF
jgi:hypothetical protein